MQLIKIELDEFDAKDFVNFQKYYVQFKYLLDEGVFDIKGGNATIDFDDAGNINRVIRQLYSKRSQPNIGIPKML